MEIKFPDVTRSGVELPEDMTLSLLAAAGYKKRGDVWYDECGQAMAIGEIDRLWRSRRGRKLGDTGEYRGPTYEPWPESSPLSEAQSEVEASVMLDDAPPSVAAKYLAIADEEADRDRVKRHAATEYREPEVATEMQRAATLLANQHIRAREAGVESTLTPAEWISIRESFAGRCVYCNRPSLRLTIDHMVPIARRGPNTASNVVAACGPCNTSKWSHDLVEWLQQRGFDEVAVFSRIAAARARVSK